MSSSIFERPRHTATRILRCVNELAFFLNNKQYRQWGAVYIYMSSSKISLSNRVTVCVFVCVSNGCHSWLCIVTVVVGVGFAVCVAAAVAFAVAVAVVVDDAVVAVVVVVVVVVGCCCCCFVCLLLLWW